MKVLDKGFVKLLRIVTHNTTNMNKYILILIIGLIVAIVAIIAPPMLTKYISDSLDIAFIATILLTFCGLIIWSVSGLIIAIIKLLKKK